jgi:hypothetical protein
MEQSKLQQFQNRAASTNYEILRQMFIDNRLDYMANKFTLICNGVTFVFNTDKKLTDVTYIRRSNNERTEHTTRI